MKTLSFMSIILALFLFTNTNSFAQTKCTDCKCESCGTACCSSGKCSGESSTCCSGKSCCKKESGSKINESGKDAVTGEAIPEAKAIEFYYLGVKYYFANEENLAKFKSEPIDYAKDLMCPIMGDAAAKEYFTEYNGAKYYVCCPPCLKKVNKDPEKYLNPEKK